MMNMSQMSLYQDLMEEQNIFWSIEAGWHIYALVNWVNIAQDNGAIWTKPRYEPMLTYCYSDPEEYIALKIKHAIYNF